MKNKSREKKRNGTEKEDDNGRMNNVEENRDEREEQRGLEESKRLNGIKEKEKVVNEWTRARTKIKRRKGKQRKINKRIEYIESKRENEK